MRSLTRRLEVLEAAHAEASMPAPIGIATCPLLQGESYSVTVPESGERQEFSTEAELFAFMDKRGLIGDGLLMVPGLRSEEDWLAAVAQAGRK